MLLCCSYCVDVFFFVLSLDCVDAWCPFWWYLHSGKTQHRKSIRCRPIQSDISGLIKLVLANDVECDTIERLKNLVGPHYAYVWNGYCEIALYFLFVSLNYSFDSHLECASSFSKLCLRENGYIEMHHHKHISIEIERNEKHAIIVHPLRDSSWKIFSTISARMPLRKYTAILPGKIHHMERTAKDESMKVTILNNDLLLSILPKNRSFNLTFVRHF